MFPRWNTSRKLCIGQSVIVPKMEHIEEDLYRPKRDSSQDGAHGVTAPKMEHIEEALYRSTTKLNAALARSRIKSRVLSIDWLLPDSVRKNEKIGCRMHVTCWVNYVKTRCAIVRCCKVGLYIEACIEPAIIYFGSGGKQRKNVVGYTVAYVTMQIVK